MTRAMDIKLHSTYSLGERVFVTDNKTEEVHMGTIIGIDFKVRGNKFNPEDVFASAITYKVLLEGVHGKHSATNVINYVSGNNIEIVKNKGE